MRERDDVLPEEGSWRGEGVARDVMRHPTQSVITRRIERSWRRVAVFNPKVRESRQNFRPAVSLTFQGAEVGGRPVGVMCHVLAGEDEVRRGSHGAPGLLPGSVQSHVPQHRPAPLRTQPLGESILLLFHYLPASIDRPNTPYIDT
ncbi:unnamed protein product [Colias eurytheme]|nr:unnamed protein product [Colias eurytheme]